jgi:hypothetical protein
MLLFNKKYKLYIYKNKTKKKKRIQKRKKYLMDL